MAPQITRAKSGSGSETTETMQSINGRVVPLERVEEHVLRDDASGRVVERLLWRYDPQGNQTTPIEQTIEERKRPDGSSTLQTTTYRGDINGSMQLTEKTLSESHKNDSGETSETVIQRPTINGSAETVEKRSAVKVNQPNGYQAETTTYRRDGSRGFYTAVRQTVARTQQGSQSTDNTAEYEAGPAEQLRQHSQTVANTVTRADGPQDVVVDIYGRTVPGTVGASDCPLITAGAANHRENARPERYGDADAERAKTHGFRSDKPGSATATFSDGVQGRWQAVARPTRGLAASASPARSAPPGSRQSIGPHNAADRHRCAW